MASSEDLFDDEFDEIIINLVPAETVSAICNGTHPALDFVLNEEPKAPKNIKISALQKIKLPKTTEEMISNLKPMWEAAIKQLKEYELYKIGPAQLIEKRMTTLEVLKSMLEKPGQSSCFESISIAIFSILKGMEKFTFASDAKQTLWKEFYRCLASNEYRVLWDPLREIIYVNFDILVFNLSLKLMEIFLNENIITDSRVKDTSLEISKMDVREQNIIKYVAGFIPFVLKKRYEHSENESSQRFHKVLSSWSDCKNDSKSFLLKDKWINLVDRGGLVNVNDSCFLFFRSVEKCVRGIFNVEYLRLYDGENLKHLILKNVLESTQVINNWDIALGENEMPPNEKETLLKTVAQYWIDMRGRAFMRAWVDDLRAQREKDISHKGEHSLRKQLNTSKKSN